MQQRKIFILDTSVSLVNRGKIRLAAKLGKKIPKGSGPLNAHVLTVFQRKPLKHKVWGVGGPGSQELFRKDFSY